MANTNGWHFFMNPGPTNIPDRVLRAMDRGTLDFTGAAFKAISDECFAGLQSIFKTKQPILGYASTGHGAWEAALVNLFSPGDKVLVAESGYFSMNWGLRAESFGLRVETLANDWRRPVDPAKLEARLRDDKAHEIKAVLAVHNETSTGVCHPIAAMRKAIDAAQHPALFCVDTISSLGSFDFRMDEWGVDVTVVGSQKGLMLPTGMAFTGVSAKAIAANAVATLPRVYWDWRRLLGGGNPQQGYWNGTIPVHFFYGLQEALRMFEEEGLDNVFARHARLAEATRRAVKHWGLDIVCRDAKYYSPTLTAAILPDNHNADAFRALALETFNISYGSSFGALAGKYFRIGHLGDINDAMLMGALSVTEMTLALAGVPHKKGGAQAAMDYLVSAHGRAAKQAAE